MWREYQHTLQQQALSIEPARLQQVFEHQKLEQYPLIFAHRETLRDQLQQQQQALCRATGAVKQCIFDRPILASIVASLGQFAQQLLPDAAPHREFLNCLQQTVLKYEGCGIVYQKDRLLQDAYDVLCDELLAWKKRPTPLPGCRGSVGSPLDSHWAEPSSQSPSPTAALGSSCESEGVDTEAEGDQA